jgi:GNAT superfamily N-acetyltransferase
MLGFLRRPKEWNYAKLVPFTNPYMQPDTVADIVDVYRDVFTEDPWNEGFECPKCGTAYHKRAKKRLCDSEECKGLRVMLVEPWTVSRVTSDIYRETTTAGAKCLLAYKRRRLVGFAWGYPKTVTPEVCKKLDASGLEQQLRGDYFYVDEVAVLPNYRKRGIATRLFAKLIDGENNRVFLRTHAGTKSLRPLAEKAGMKIVMSISRNRVIMAF